MEKRGRETLVHLTKETPYSLYTVYFEPKPSQALYLHWHPEIEICYLEEGTMDYYVEDVCWHMKAGEAALVPSNLLHRADGTSEKGGMFKALVFGTDLISSQEGSRIFQRYVDPILSGRVENGLLLTRETEWQKQILEDLKRLFRLAETGSDMELAARGVILLMWQGIYDNYISRSCERKEEKRLEGMLEASIRYMREHYGEDMRLCHLAELAHMSEGQFCRCFKQLMGVTPFAWLKRCRIRESCLLLSGSDKKISEIASLSGFNHIGYFNREFLRLMKITPSEYRRLEKGNVKE